MHQVLPTLRDAKQHREQQEAPTANGAGANGVAGLDPTQYPLGFSTGGAVDSHANRRLPHLYDLPNASPWRGQAHGHLPTAPGFSRHYTILMSRMTIQAAGLVRRVKRATSLECGAGADAKVDAAATVLRMLLIKDLRGLQTQIDDMIAQIQVCARDTPGIPGASLP